MQADADSQMIETTEQAAQRLSRSARSHGFQPEALHEYRSTDNLPLYWKIRLKHPESGEKWIRPMKRAGNQYTIGEPKFPDGKPLYRLPDLAARMNEPVVVVEGEWCADALARIGVLATTSGSADSATRADWRPLAGRDILIWPDNDDPGRAYAEAVFQVLEKAARSVRIIAVDARGATAKTDAVDWLRDNPHATIDDIVALPAADLSASNDAAIDESETVEGAKESAATALVSFALELAEFFHDQNGDVYATDRINGETRRLGSRLFRDWFVSNYYELSGNAPREQALKQAFSTLSGLGRFKGDCRSVFVRVAQYDGCYFLDLAEPGRDRVVKIEPGHWSIVSPSPVPFVRSETCLALPEPMSGTTLDALWSIANVPKEARLLVIAWLCDCLRPDTPFPVLELIGEQGSAKSTTQSALRRLIDPNSCNLRTAPKSAEDSFITAGVNWLVSYENVSHLSAPMQDALCVMATGGGFAKRKLYSDADESVISVKRPIILNGICASVTAQDLMDRTISIEMPTVSVRTETTSLWQCFDSEHGKLLGALLDAMAAALQKLPEVTITAEQRPRMIEFVRFGAAIALALDATPAEFIESFRACRLDAVHRTIDANPVAAAVMTWLEENPEGATDTASNLMRRIEQFSPPRSESWPRSGKGFADALRRTAPALRQLGINCHSLPKTGGVIQWTIIPQKISVASCPESPASPGDASEQDIRTFRTSNDRFPRVEPGRDGLLFGS